jgi:hypothetical protein
MELVILAGRWTFSAMVHSWFKVWPLVLAFGGSCGSAQAAAPTDPGLELAPPIVTNGVVELRLRGEAHVAYVIEGSTNLLAWQPVATNSDPLIERSILLESAPGQKFFRAWRSQLPVFAGAIATTGNFDLAGKIVRMDSFDSADPLYSNGGFYPVGDISKQKDNAHLLVMGDFTNSLGGGTLKVKGTVRTKPGGTVDMGPQDVVGSKLWVESGNLGIQPGYLLDDLNVMFPSVELPASTGWVPLVRQNPPVNIGGVNYDYVITEGDWLLAELVDRIYVSGAARVHVTDRVHIIGSSVVWIGPGGSLRLYVSASSAFIGAGYGVINESENLNNFTYFGLPSNKSLILGANAHFFGAIYAPATDLLLGGGGADEYDFIGAIVSHTVKINGRLYFHFDENLSRIGPLR